MIQIVNKKFGEYSCGTQSPSSRTTYGTIQDRVAQDRSIPPKYRPLILDNRLPDKQTLFWMIRKITRIEDSMIKTEVFKAKEEENDRHQLRSRTKRGRVKRLMELHFSFVSIPQW